MHVESDRTQASRQLGHRLAEICCLQFHYFPCGGAGDSLVSINVILQVNHHTGQCIKPLQCLTSTLQVFPLACGSSAFSVHRGRYWLLPANVKLSQFPEAAASCGDSRKAEGPRTSYNTKSPWWSPGFRVRIKGQTKLQKTLRKLFLIGFAFLGRVGFWKASRLCAADPLHVYSLPR